MSPSGCSHLGRGGGSITGMDTGECYSPQSIVGSGLVSSPKAQVAEWVQTLSPSKDWHYAKTLKD